jgi:serine/threonine protein kinase
VASLDTAVLADNPPGDFTKQAGTEPIPGYRLLQPLGAGSFGEVWKCEVPGGLAKAIKFVYGNLDNPAEGSALAAQELRALHCIKAIRHPFLLNMERVEILGGELLIVMELADKSLHDVLTECQAAGQPGIPRDELLALLQEAAEALDLMNFQHGLQHLDVKPRNLFLIGNHLKVADFGLVNGLSDDPGGVPRQLPGGFTPLYSAPEILLGKISRHSDQYSLAIVYQELLTGTLPFQGKNGRQLMLQHLSGTPNLEPLPVEDRPWIARALAKGPEQRFPSCQALVTALVEGFDASANPAALASRNTGTARVRRPRLARRGSPDPAAGPVVPPGSAGDQTAEPSQTVAAAEDQTPAAPPAPGDLVPGHRLLTCLGQSALGELWKVQGSDGQELLAHLLNSGGDARAQGRLLGLLQALRHAALPPAEVVRGAGGRIALVTDFYPQTLRDRLQECLAQRQPGVPRDELLSHLARTADALDTLYRQHGLAHLGLNPRSLFLRDGKVWVADFGLVPLVWLPQKRSAAPLNQRYGAPELADGPGGPAADQYSLAMIFAELLTGIHPLKRKRKSDGGRRRNDLPGSPAPELELDLLPATDRPIIARALNPDPQQRYPSCTDMVRALEEVTGKVARAQKPREEKLPAVIPFGSLFGEAPPPDLRLPAVSQLVIQAIAANNTAPRVAQEGDLRYFSFPGGILEYQCATPLWPGMLHGRLEDFPRQWDAEPVERADDACVYRIKHRGSFLQRWSRPRGLEVRIRLLPPPTPESTVHCAQVRIEPYGGDLPPNLQELGPRLIENLRSRLQSEPERRARPRVPCPQPLRIYAVLPGLELAEVVEGLGWDISVGGIGFLMPKAPASRLLYLQLNANPQLAAFAVLARVVWTHPCPDGSFRVGAMFAPPREKERG